jgi:hypothetical protein
MGDLNICRVYASSTLSHYLGGAQLYSVAAECAFHERCGCVVSRGGVRHVDEKEVKLRIGGVVRKMGSVKPR